jgi:hypothetical protein
MDKDRISVKENNTKKTKKREKKRKGREKDTSIVRKAR